jgi:hypothetical protein
MALSYRIDGAGGGLPGVPAELGARFGSDPLKVENYV